MLDPRGCPVSCDDRGVLELYERALRQQQTFVGDPVAAIEQALAARPDFVLGHAFRAGVLMTWSEQRFAERARESVVAAEALAGNARERGHVAAARLLVDGDWAAACDAYDRVLVEHPRDALALQVAHLFDFYRGDSLNLRNRVSRVLPHWSESVPGYSYVLGMHAFGLEECNQYRAAEDTAFRALSIERRDGWAVHAGAHVMEMEGRVDDGIHFLTSREQDWAPESGFALHNWWHLALLHLDRDDVREVLAIYDRVVTPELTDMSVHLVDATSLLFRLHLLGQDVGARMAPLAVRWAERLERERGFYAFNDVHAMAAFVACGDDGGAARLLVEMEHATHATNRVMVRDVGLPVARAFLAFGRGDYATTVEELARVRDTAHRFGGSHAQRDVLTLTLVEAALRSGRTRVAEHYLAERAVHRPGSQLANRLLARGPRAR